jgi:large-conductance mechanosensitive channel
MQLIRDQVRLFLVLIFGLIVVMSQSLPFRLAGIPLALFALWTGFRALVHLRKLRRGGSRAPGAITLATGMSLSAVLLFLLIADAVYYPLVRDLENCQAAAQTQSASDACQREAKTRISELLERFSREASSTP